MSNQDLIANFNKYIEFSFGVLFDAYQYGGKVFDAREFPSFKEFENNLGDERYDFTARNYATDYSIKNGYGLRYVPSSSGSRIKAEWNDKNKLERDYCNCIARSMNGVLYRVKYSIYRGVKWNEEIILGKIVELK